ncbi:MAG: electron transfer flavoprotein subunit alpha/FixB family protein [Thermodesulfobacteriota bacterium]
MAEYKGILVHCEVKADRLAGISTGLLGAGNRLAKELGQELGALLIGSNVGDVAKEAIAFGASKVYVVDNPVFQDYVTESYVSAMDKIVKRVMPQIVLLGQTSLGRDLAPRLAFRLNTAASLDCVSLAIDPASKRLLQTKPVYGGNAQATFICASDPQIATVRAKVMSPLERDPDRQGEIITIDAGIDPAAIKTKLLERKTEEVAGVKLEEARVIVCGGRGVGSAEGFKQLEELAKLFNKGTIGASRPPCENGWVPDSLQIGLTGKIVTPDLYFAVALSGSSQHLSGCSGAKTTVAINKDPEANIFKVANHGVVGDWRKVLPALTVKVKQLLAG